MIELKPDFHFNKLLSLIHNLKETSYEYEAIVLIIIGGATASTNTILAVAEMFQKKIHAFKNPNIKAGFSQLISRS